MKTTKWIISAAMATVLVGITIAISGCTEKDSSQTQGQTAGKTVQYTCAMHPDVVQDKPGKCPKCGMDLIVKK